jgi:hypothetical protein
MFGTNTDETQRLPSIIETGKMILSIISINSKESLLFERGREEEIKDVCLLHATVEKSLGSS